MRQTSAGTQPWYTFSTKTSVVCSSSSSSSQVIIPVTGGTPMYTTGPPSPEPSWVSHSRCTRATPFFQSRTGANLAPSSLS